jgi:hypothetical protein
MKLKLSPITIQLRVVSKDKSDKETAKQETRKIMDDIWARYPRAQVAKSEFEKGKVIFDV